MYKGQRIKVFQEGGKLNGRPHKDNPFIVTGKTRNAVKARSTKNGRECIFLLPVRKGVKWRFENV